jgi:predicted transcriptional regulator
VGTTIRVSDRTKARIAAMAHQAGRPMTEVLDAAVDALERKLFLEGLNDRFAEIRADPDEWAEIERERSVEEGATTDGSA